MPVPQSTERAVRAALAVGRRLGLPTDSPRLLRDATNVLLQLAPAPVVARVPLTLSRLRSPAWFAQEVSLARFLVDAGAPVAPPTAAFDPGPHTCDGLLVSLWELVEHHPSRADSGAAGRSLRVLHDALLSYGDPLPTCDRMEEIGALLEQLQPSRLASAADLDGLRAAHDRLSAAPRLAGRPLHGDAHLNNVLWGPRGPLWTDLENACSGPIEYDLACIAWRAGQGTKEALAAYGEHDPEAIRRCEPYLALFLAVWTIVVVERSWTVEGAAEASRRIGRALATS